MKNKFCIPKIMEILLSIVLIVVGVCVVTFAIVNWCGASPDADPTLALRILVGIIFVGVGLFLMVYTLAAERKTTVFGPISAGAILIAFGCFMFFKEAGAVMEILLSLLVPLSILCFGAALLSKAILMLINKLNNKLSIFLIVVGALFLVGGILLVVFRDRLTNLPWVLIGVSVTISGITYLVNCFRKKEIDVEQ